MRFSAELHAVEASARYGHAFPPAWAGHPFTQEKKAMTNRRTLLVAALVAPAAALAFTLGGAGGLDDTQQIKQNTKDFAAAWNKHDPAAMSKFWARDGDLYCPQASDFKTGAS